MTLGTTNLIGRTMTTEGTMTVTATATATVHAIMTMVATATDGASVETETEIVTAAATMKNGIMTVDVINATIVTVDATAHRADVQGVGDATTDRGHPDVVHVSSPQTPSIRSPRLSVSNPFFLQLPVIAAGVPRHLHRVVAHHDDVHPIPAQLQM
jgi:hypothetical protein